MSLRSDAWFDQQEDSRDDHAHEPWPEVSYGAMARAAAMVAGDPDWVNVTRWPREGEVAGGE